MTNRSTNKAPKKPYSVWLPLLAFFGVLIYLFRSKVVEISQSLIKPLQAWFITQGFGSNHNGIDIRAAIGTEVLAPASGTVVNIYTNTQGGLQMLIKHDNGYTTGYAHLSKTLVAVNAKVKQGQTVALTGNTGTSTGPHLHFTLRNGNNELIDPTKFLA